MRRCFVTLLLFAFVCRVAIPFGFMLAPSADARDALTIVICTDHGPVSAVLDEDGVPAPSRHSNDICPFAASALPALANQPPQLAFEVTYASVTYKLAQIQFSLTPQPRTTYARGPPTVV